MTESPVVLITGAAHRLGAATARHLHQRGWRVIVHYRSRQQQAEDLVAALNRQRAESAIALAADLSQPAEVDRLARQAVAHWGRLDGLVNNASVFYPTPTASATGDDWDTLLHTNLRAPFLLVQGCLPALQRASGGIVNLIDIYHQRPLADHPLYCASKSGLATLTRAWAKDLAPAVRVNGVSPGAILWPESGIEADQAHQQAILDKTPLGRTGTPEDIAGAVAFLLCDAPFITGQILAVDGGRSLNM
ncbi:MAG: pteridine reductase [Marinobacter sp.]|uniref:pteridine reductase n=1 Tax=Marinobacter sp. TaxID=50741 RepID=UPI00299F2251|nr:pteridine reductase [Marinobacter sp.]MDX1755474.1 pteridine reductase [Marinobacter sp.]